MTSYSLAFFDGGSGGGSLLFDPNVVIDAEGNLLFTGTLNAPVFKLGTFATTPFSSTPGAGTLTITAIPEPANWALLIAGFGLTGAVLRRRRATAFA